MSTRHHSNSIQRYRSGHTSLSLQTLPSALRMLSVICCGLDWNYFFLSSNSVKMAAWQQTPEKITDISCCFCFRTNLSNCYSLSGPKFSKFNNLFSSFLSSNQLLQEITNIPSTRLCRGCFQKIQNCISFRQEAVTNLIKFRDGYQQSKKRMANFSPDLE